MGKRPRLYLIDGHALAYRTYYALTRASDGSRWMTKSGEPTAGTYGFVSVLLRVIEQDAPDYLAVSFDTGRTFRDDMYPDYKATREKMPDDLQPQIERIRQLVQAFRIPVLEAEGFEADDVLGTVARLAADLGAQVVILTGDRDLLQLASPNIHILLAGQKLSEAVDYGPEEVSARYGLAPSQLVDLKALIGDSSDNIPGVRGIGEKTAVALLQEHRTLDAIYDHLEQVAPRFRTKLEEGRESAYLSRGLGTIVTDVPIAFDLQACRLQGYDREAVSELFRQLEFRTLLTRLQAAAEEPGLLPGRQQLPLFISPGAQPAQAGPTTWIVNTSEDLARLARQLGSASVLAIDTETTSTDPMAAALVGISLATEAGAGIYLPVGHSPAWAGGAQLDLAQVVDGLRSALAAPHLPKVGHNLKYDYIVLARHGLPVAPLAFDTMLAEWLCDPASRNLGLKSLAWVRLGRDMTEIETLIGSGKNQRSMADVPIDQVAPYAAADAEICLALLPQLEAEMKEKGQAELFRQMEMPLVSVLAEMEMAGIRLDVGFLGTLSQQLAVRLAELEGQVYNQVGHEFNINSTQQLSQVLFVELGLEPPDRTRKTAAGRYSTAASVLDELRHKHRVVDLILEHREISKLKSTYTDALPARVLPATGRVHTSYSQTGSVTGRLASSDPNLQNIPIRTELGRQIRNAFIAEDGQALLSVDYSQIELRIVAHMARDQAMIQAFLDDQDIHAATAAAVFGGDPATIAPDLRRHAKAVNFGLIYGMSAYGLSRSTDMTLAEAETFVKVYFQRFPGVRAYLEHTRRLAAEQGFVETLFGRRRYFPQLAPTASGVPEVNRARAEREAINAPIQGTAADVIKIAMMRLPAALAKAGLHAHMLLQVHDELVFEVPLDEVGDTVSCVQAVMEAAVSLEVPLKTDAKVGRTWADMQPA
ncbi:MAG: DNA polymerase I [Anaerolineales bacterium]|nr:DNA polymerase I [Anaerolineales bacterium]